VESAASLFENRAPQKNRTGERDQSERRAQKIIPTINERVLEPDVEYGNVFVSSHTKNRIRKPGSQELNFDWRASPGAVAPSSPCQGED
jgi:hypothetical protein